MTPRLTTSSSCPVDECDLHDIHDADDLRGHLEDDHTPHEIAVTLARLATQPRAGIFAEIEAERLRQDERFGEQNHPDGTGLPIYRSSARRYREHAQRAAADGVLTWRDILQEEVHEGLAEADWPQLRAELIQVGAVAVCWIEAGDRRPTQRFLGTHRVQQIRPSLARELIDGARRGRAHAAQARTAKEADRA